MLSQSKQNQGGDKNPPKEIPTRKDPDQQKPLRDPSPDERK